MKKAILAALILSLLLAALTACGGETQQPAAPEPAAETKPLASAEKAEISQEELEAIFKKVYTETSENSPEDGSVDSLITEEIEKVTQAIPEDKKAPSNLRELYAKWRTDTEEYAEIDKILADMEASLEDYEQADPETIAAGAAEEDIKKYQDTSGEPSYDEGRDYVEDPSVIVDNSDESYKNDPDYINPRAGLTEEEIQQQIEESFNVECSNIHGG